MTVKPDFTDEELTILNNLVTRQYEELERAAAAPPLAAAHFARENARAGLALLTPLRVKLLDAVSVELKR